jgi:hypothetical protein
LIEKIIFLTPVILATQEAEIGRFKADLSKKFKRPHLNKLNKKKDWT